MRTSKIAVLFLLVATTAGCPFVTTGTGNGFVGATGGSGGGGSPSTSSSSGGGASSSSSSSGTGGGPVCKAGEMVSCYDGPTGTENVGACKDGYQTCKQDGSGYGGCVMATLPMPDNCASGLNLHCDTPAPVCAGTLSPGGKAFGESGADTALAVAVDSKGNTIVSGSFHGTLDFGDGKPLKTPDGGSDAFVAQYDPTGKLNWVVQIGDKGDDVASALAVDGSDDVFVAGSFTTAVAFAPATPTPITGGPGIFVAKLDSTDEAHWASGYLGAGKHAANAVALSPDGKHVAVAGATSNALVVGTTSLTTSGMGDFDGYVFSVDAATGQTVEWVRQVGTMVNSENQYLTGAVVDSDGSVVVTGYGTGDVDFNDGTGAVTTHGNGQNVILARCEPSKGKTVWKQLFGDDMTTNFGQGVALDGSGDILLTGGFQKHIQLGTLSVAAPAMTMPGATAMLVARLDGTGNGTWATSVAPDSGMGTAMGLGIASDAYGVVVGGYFTDTLLGATPALTSKGGEDALAMKLSVKTGDILWTRQLGDAMDDQVNGVALDPRQVDPLGASVIVGSFSKIVDVGGGAVNGAGATDVFFARLSP